MKINLTGKTAIVTGSTTGIGWGCARGLAGAGATVVLAARAEDALAKAREKLRDAVPGGAVRTVAVDLSIAEGCNRLMAAEPSCDILVNNLGRYEPKPFFETTDQDWQSQFDINLMPGVRLSRGYMPKMVADGWGRIVFLSSIDGVLVTTDSLQYGVAKAGVLALSRGLAKLAGNSGVTVNAVIPGPAKTEWMEASIEQAAGQSGKTFAEAAHQGVIARYPSSLRGTLLTTDEVANLVVYLCSPQSSATTGSALRADGGIVEGLY